LEYKWQIWKWVPGEGVKPFIPDAAQYVLYSGGEVNTNAIVTRTYF
jgi:hypothetical protein